MRLRARAVTGAVAVLVLAVGAPVGLAVPAQAAVSAPAVSVPAGPPTGLALAEGDEGRLIVKLQRRLGISPPAGYFGPRTHAAVLAVQQAHGLPATGIVDDATWLAVRDDARAARAARATTQAAPAPEPAAEPAAVAVDEAPAGVNAAFGGGVVDYGDDAALRAAIIATAASLRGIPYVAGGTTPSGFDCSGYTSYVFRVAIGMTIPRVSRDQYAFSEHITRAEAQPGDLVFYHSGGRVYHVAIYAGNGMVWHSPRTGDVVSKVRIWSSNVYYGRVL